MGQGNGVAPAMEMPRHLVLRFHHSVLRHQLHHSVLRLQLHHSVPSLQHHHLEPILLRLHSARQRHQLQLSDQELRLQLLDLTLGLQLHRLKVSSLVGTLNHRLNLHLVDLADSISLLPMPTPVGLDRPIQRLLTHRMDLDLVTPIRTPTVDSTSDRARSLRRHHHSLKDSKRRVSTLAQCRRQVNSQTSTLPDRAAIWTRHLCSMLLHQLHHLKAGRKLLLVT